MSIRKFDSQQQELHMTSLQCYRLLTLLQQQMATHSFISSPMSDPSSEGTYGISQIHQVGMCSLTYYVNKVYENGSKATWIIDSRAIDHTVHDIHMLDS